MRLYTRDEIGEIDALLKELLEVLLDLMKEHTELICRALHIFRRRSR